MGLFIEYDRALCSELRRRLVPIGPKKMRPA